MRILLVLLALALPVASYAQSEEPDDDVGFIQGLLQNALSAEGREVRLEGFRGALSSTAEIDRIVVTDPDGIWLTAENVSMQWRRAALLRGRINIDEIRIGRLDLPRLPQAPPEEAPSPEARGPISLPDLPVSINLGALTVVTAELGAPIIGEALTIGITGSAQLDDGIGNVALDITRQDREGRFRVAGGFTNETRQLTVDVAVTEPAGGLVATLMDLPGTPSLDLAVTGDGPLDDFSADLALATDGQDRLSGTVTLLGVPGAEADSPAGQRFTANLAGDITPLLDPIYHDFLGESLTLAAEGLRAEDGAIDLDRLALSAEALDLAGTARIGADGWPERFDVDLTIAPPNGPRVVLPLPGDPTSLRSAALTADFDASEGEAFRVQGRVDGLQQPDLDAESLTFTATGTIDKATPTVTAVIDLIADGLDLADPALQSALGDRLGAGTRVDWQPGVPVRLQDLTLAGADYGVSGTLEIDGLEGALALELRPDIALSAQDLSRFAALSGLALGGAAEVAIAGAVTPVEGGFDLTIDGETNDLALGIPEADAILAGIGRIGITATRDIEGLRVPRLQVSTDAARIEGSADVAQGDTTANLRGEIFDTSLAVPAMSGPAVLDLAALGAGTRWNVDGTLDLPGDTLLRVDGDIDTAQSPDALSAVSLSGRVGDLSVYSQLAGQSLSGGITLDGTARGSISAQTGTLRLDTRATNLRTGIAEADALLRGDSDIVLAATRAEDGTITIEDLTVSAPGITADGSGQLLGPDGGAVDLAVRLPDLAPLLPGLPGAATLDLGATQSGSRWQVLASADAPGATQLRIEGVLETDAASDTPSDVTLTGAVGNLAAFSELAGQTLSGRIALDGTFIGSIATQSGTLRLDTQATNLRTGIAEADALLRGNSTIALAATRAEDGRLDIEDLSVSAPGITADGSGQLLGPDGGAVDLVVRLPDLAPLLPGLSGAAAIDLGATQSGSRWQVLASADAPGATQLRIDGMLETDAASDSPSTIDITGAVGNLAAFSELAGRALNGRIALDGTLIGSLATQSGTLRLDTQGTDLRTSIPQADALLRGESTIALRAARDDDGTLLIETLDVSTPGVQAEASGQLLGPRNGNVDLAVRLPNLAPVVPILPGAGSLDLTARQTGDRWQLTAAVDAPGNTQVRADGSVAADASNVDLTVTGRAPLAIANSFLNGQTIDGPLSFNLAVRGAPGLDAVSGTVTIGNTRVAVPAAQVTLEDLSGTIALASGRAQIDLDSRLGAGGRLEVGGPVTLSDPFVADIAIQLRDAIIQQDDLLETRINGTVTIAGALTGGAAIGGDLLLDPVELQIPNIGPSYASLEGLTHENLPAEVRQTLLSAKLISAETAGAAPSFPIDLTIRAPQRIFVRGRGLNAELGGSIRITGRTDNLVPVGQFELLRGELNVLTRDVDLDVGEIDIQGSFDPVLLFSASTNADDTQITIRLDGVASDPELTLTSVPELPEDEVLSLFLFGTGIQNISPLQAVRLAAAARTLSGSGGLGFTSGIRDQLGVDSFDIDIGDDGVASASVGTYISDNIYTDLTVDSEGETQIELNLEVTDSTTVRGRSNSTGESSLGVFFERDY